MFSCKIKTIIIQKIKLNLLIKCGNVYVKKINNSSNALDSNHIVMFNVSKPNVSSIQNKIAQRKVHFNCKSSN